MPIEKMNKYRVADASIIGTSHRRMKYKNQDASSVKETENLIVGIVCDGCGSSAHSEVGAQLGARFIANKCIELFSKDSFDAKQLCREIVHYLHQFTSISCVGSIDEFVDDYLLFTIIGFVVKPITTHLFWAGDGVTIVNDQVKIIDQANRPKYLAYNLLGDKTDIEHHKFNTKMIDRLLIGSDGVENIISNQGKTFGNNVAVSSINELFEHEQFFSHPAALSKFLSDLEATESILFDDTTMILLNAI